VGRRVDAGRAPQLSTPDHPEAAAGSRSAPRRRRAGALHDTPAVFGVRCWLPGPGDDIVTAMSGEQAAGGGVGINPGTCGDAAGWGLLHVLAGYQVSGGGLRAVCRCGQTGPPRAGEDRAAAALDAQHRLDPLHCGVCERQRVSDIVLCRPEEVGLVIHPAISGPFPDIEYLAGADDLPTCAQLAAQLQQRLAHSAAEADAHYRRLRRPPPATDPLAIRHRLMAIG
jgi:hypothetical protein